MVTFIQFVYSNHIPTLFLHDAPLSLSVSLSVTLLFLLSIIALSETGIWKEGNLHNMKYIFWIEWNIPRQQPLYPPLCSFWRNLWNQCYRGSVSVVPCKGHKIWSHSRIMMWSWHLFAGLVRTNRVAALVVLALLSAVLFYEING